MATSCQKFSAFTLNRIFPILSQLSRVIMPKGSSGGFYAVRKGRTPGVYSTWDDCQEQTKGFSGARYKKFPTQSQAEAFVRGEPDDGANGQPSGDTTTSNPAPPTYTRPKYTAPGYSTPKVADVAMSRAVRTETGGGREYRSSTSSDSGIPDTPAPSANLSETELGQLTSVSTKLSEAVTTIKHSLDEGSGVVRGLRVKTASFPGSVKDALREYDDLLLEAQTQIQALDHTVSEVNILCQHLQHGKRSHSPTNDNGGAADNTGENASKKVKSQASSSQRGVRSVIVYTDGCCHNNGRGEASAGYGVYWGPQHPNNVGEKLGGRQTNNRAEIYAAQKAIEQARLEGYDEIVVYTDSKFLINCITKWIHKWKKNDWKLSNGGDVINKPDLEELEQTMDGIIVKWEHVKGHAGIPGNEAADRLANEGARKRLQ